MNPKKYRLCDLYEDYGIIGEFDTYGEICQAAERWKAETDGECDLIMFRWNASAQSYEPAIVK